MQFKIEKELGTGYDGIAVAIFSDIKTLPIGLDLRTVDAVKTVSSDSSLINLYSSDLIMPEAGAAASRILVIGAGNSVDYELLIARRLAGSAARILRRKGARKIALLLPTGNLPVGDAAQAFMEGIVTSSVDGQAYKTTDKYPKLELEEVTLIISEHLEVARSRAEKGVAIGQGINLARRLADEPANLLTPADLAEEAQKVALANGLEFEALDKTALEMGGFKAILAVGQGSVNEPRIIVIKYNGASKESPILGLVGKGITFDSGGISIKPAAGMENLKYDMSGGAWVIAVMQIAAQLKLEINLIGVVAAAENLPGAGSYRPGDVIGSLEGKTIEVDNTDAEGRIVLADGVAYARKLGAARLVDLATLTGAARIALGSSIAPAVFGSDKAWTALFMETAEKAGERAWQMPLFPEYSQLIKSKIADITNSVPNVGGGASLGAAFIKEFTGGVPWIHLDIAPVSRTEEKPFMAKGSSGHLIRTLVDFVEANAGSRT